MALEPLITQSQPNLLSLLTVCLKHPQAPVRQSAYALVGDMAMGCFTLLRPHMPGIMAELTLQLDPEPKVEFISASNNAAWSVGEVALRYGRGKPLDGTMTFNKLIEYSDDPEFHQWVNPLISRLIPILLHPKAPRSLHENAAVSIGRIGLMHPTLVAPHLPEFAQAWCQALYEIRDNEEKDSAFRGLCTLVQINPAGIAKASVRFPTCCHMFVNWRALAEPALVLQLYCPMEPTLARVERDVPATPSRIQAARCRWLGRAGGILPPGHPGATGRTLRSIEPPSCSRRSKANWKKFFVPINIIV